MIRERSFVDIAGRAAVKSFRLTSRIYLLVAWYDLWVGVFVNVPKRHLYLFPVPCVGVLVCF